ncbi:MAG: hypothetical protein ACI8RN_002444 [Glaciecola sp.]|jgi:hypothetical protein|uniref:hypothetical protein n=1 Tax=Congregibacter sp. TaxID=2744308 RepID=UPI0039E5D66D
MKLQDIASLAEIVGGVAVIVSLVFVGVQVNDNTAAIRSAAASDATTTMQSWYIQMGGNRQASDTWFNAMISPEPLPPRDEFQFMMSMHVAILGMQNSYLLTKEGTLDAEFREAVTTAIVGVKQLPGMDRYWRQRRAFFHAEFAEYVDELLTRDTAPTVDIYKIPEVAPDQ